MPEEHIHSTQNRTTPSQTKVAAPPRTSETRALQLANGRIDYLLKWSSRARRLRLAVQPGGQIEVTAPTGTALARVEQVLREKEPWLRRALERMREATPRAAAHSTITDGMPLSFAGQSLQLHLVHDPALPRARAQLRQNILTLHVPTLDQNELHRLLERWYRHRGKALFEERLAHWNAHYSYRYARVSIKDQRSRWGSCSQKGNLNFSWRLLLAPLPVLDYVVIHELAHIKEPNHSSRFWALVAQTCPSYNEHRRWLRLHGHTLTV